MRVPPTAFLCLLFALSLVSTLPAVELLEHPCTGSFPLVEQGRAATVLLPESAPGTVKLAARTLAQDIARVTRVHPRVVEGPEGSIPGPCVQLSLSPSLAGRWEAFQISSTPDQLLIEGSDPRGLVFGIYELSRRIGVSPWHWWADVPVPHRDSLYFSPGKELPEAPAVRYRGIFLNDEDWGLEPWARLTHEPEQGTIGPKTYARIFELLLRLRANTLWPAMHGCTKPFHQVPGNAAMADSYGIVLGSSHAEPMLRNNVGEWTAPKEDYNFVKNPGAVTAYWETRVRERAQGESLFTLGMRGIHDSAIVGPKSQSERIATLEQIFSVQRGLLARYLGSSEGVRAAQIFCPYKEVLDDYNAGLRVPEDVTLVWPDDNFGYLRRFPTPAEQQRPGGSGLYYHASYLGSPMAWLWVDTLHPALLWSELSKAYEQGVRQLWVVNVGDLKNCERSMELFLSLAWAPQVSDPQTPRRLLDSLCQRDFGQELGTRISALLWEHYHLAFARRPEQLQWHLPLTPYQPCTLSEAGMIERLDAYARLEQGVRELEAGLAAGQADAFFELVSYPLLATAAANERYFSLELARVRKARGDAVGDLPERSEQAEQRIQLLTTHYNEGVAGGKWRHVVCPNGLSPRTWARFQPTPALPPLSSDAQQAVTPRPTPTAGTPLARPPGARSGDYVEHDGLICLEVAHPTGSGAGRDGASWVKVPGLGRSGHAATVLPTTAVLTEGASPWLAWRFYVSSAGLPKLRLRLLPTYPIVPGQGLRLAYSLDGGTPVTLALTQGFDTKSSAWKERVLSNAAELVAPLSAAPGPGWHEIRIHAMDTGVVLDQLVLDFTEGEPPYEGRLGTRLD